jgi:hypothetical protein
MKIERVIRRVSADGSSVVNAAVTASIGEPGSTSVTSAQHVDVVQHGGRTQIREHPTDKES